VPDAEAFRFKLSLPRFVQGNEAFPYCGQGVLIELVQAPPEVIAALG
jgi:hypothetical protein